VRTFLKLLADYAALTKPRALFMIVFTTGIAYLIAATNEVRPIHLLHTLFGVLLSAGGSLAVNQHMERGLDARMDRTRDRPIPAGRIKPAHAAVFGWTVMLTGYVYLWFLVNPGCAIATMACGVSYNFMYTPMKLTSTFSSFVGAIPGGLLPIMGWVAARGQLEIGAWILFMILFLWQIPHALIISIRHQEDYAGAGMKQLPVITGHLASNRQIILNVLVLVPVTMLPYFFNMTRVYYPIAALALGAFLFYQAVRYATQTNGANAKRIFVSLTAYLPLLLVVMYLDKPA
jgi:protoheme IX farnesyltransferase